MPRSKYSKLVPKAYGNIFDDLITVVCDVFLVSPEEIWGYRGSERAIWARMLMYKMTYAKLQNKKEVARMFGKHHASVVNGLVKLNWYVQQIVRLKNLCEEVGKRLNIKMFAAA
tara:strand:- start:689 stop:1030 length:342 start_codon:yes stop_codon:yes gene_type:complete